MIEKTTYKKIHVQFDHADRDFRVFYQERSWECLYDNAPLPQLPHVQCETGGFCQSGSEFRIFPFRSRFNKTCDACVMFMCSVIGKQAITGSGSYDDFVTTCININPNGVERFNEKKDDRDYGIKSNFYYDSNADNCHKYAFDNYVTKIILFDIFDKNVDKYAKEICFYEVTAPPTTTSSTTPEVVSHFPTSFLPTSTKNLQDPTTENPHVSKEPDQNLHVPPKEPDQQV